MTPARKRRAARRKLKAHDRGENRHNKTVAFVMKEFRKRESRNLTYQAKAKAAKSI